jgi:metal-responsive CopG/Arc/MetJ family transcriptional regulator
MGRPRVYSDRTVISNIGIERRLLAELDKYAAKHGLTRSQAVAAAVEAWLQRTD